MSERNGRCAYIPDGYTRDGFIEGTDFHPDVRFTYRPTTVVERTVVDGLIRLEHAKGTETGLAKTEELAGDFLVSHLVGWDITDPDGNDVDLNAKNALGIEPHLFNRLYSIVMGVLISDETKEQGSEKNSPAG